MYAGNYPSSTLEVNKGEGLEQAGYAASTRASSICQEACLYPLLNLKFLWQLASASSRKQNSVPAVLSITSLNPWLSFPLLCCLSCSCSRQFLCLFSESFLLPLLENPFVKDALSASFSPQHLSPSVL